LPEYLYRPRELPAESRASMCSSKFLYGNRRIRHYRPISKKGSPKIGKRLIKIHSRQIAHKPPKVAATDGKLPPDRQRIPGYDPAQPCTDAPHPLRGAAWPMPLPLMASTKRLNRYYAIRRQYPPQTPAAPVPEDCPDWPHAHAPGPAVRPATDAADPDRCYAG